MKKILAALLLALSACALLHGPPSLPADQAQDSVYKVRVILTLDTTPLHKDDPADGSKIKKIGALVDNPDLLVDAKLLSEGDNTAKVGWSGTGWVAANGVGHSYVMTAGHVCESGKVYHLEYIDWSTFTVKKVDLPILSTEHTLINRDNTEFPGGTVLADEDLDDDYNGKDLCVIGVPGYLGKAFPLATQDPPYGTSSEVIGAPTGLWGGGVAITANLKYSGRGTVFHTKTDGLSFTGEAAPGNSGSAITYQGRVVALLNLGGKRFPSLSVGVPHEEIRDFLRRALHKAP